MWDDTLSMSLMAQHLSPVPGTAEIRHQNILQKRFVALNQKALEATFLIAKEFQRLTAGLLVLLASVLAAAAAFGFCQ